MNLWALPLIVLFAFLTVANVWLEVAYRRTRRRRLHFAADKYVSHWCATRLHLTCIDIACHCVCHGS